MKILLLENIHPTPGRSSRRPGMPWNGFRTASRKVLAQEIGTSPFSASDRNRVTATFWNAPRFLAIGAFCIGTEQVDLEACGGAGGGLNAPTATPAAWSNLPLAR